MEASFQQKEFDGESPPEYVERMSLLYDEFHSKEREETGTTGCTLSQEKAVLMTLQALEKPLTEAKVQKIRSKSIYLDDKEVDFNWLLQQVETQYEVRKSQTLEHRRTQLTLSLMDVEEAVQLVQAAKNARPQAEQVKWCQLIATGTSAGASDATHAHYPCVDQNVGKDSDAATVLVNRPGGGPRNDNHERQSGNPRARLFPSESERYEVLQVQGANHRVTQNRQTECRTCCGRRFCKAETVGECDAFALFYGQRIQEVLVTHDQFKKEGSECSWTKAPHSIKWLKKLEHRQREGDTFLTYAQFIHEKEIVEGLRNETASFNLNTPVPADYRQVPYDYGTRNGTTYAPPCGAAISKEE